MINRASLQAAFDLLEYLQGQGIQCIIAGGCARDIFFGVKPKDIDIIVVGEPTLAIDVLLKRAGYTSRLYSFYGESSSDRIRACWKISSVNIDVVLYDCKTVSEAIEALDFNLNQFAILGARHGIDGAYVRFLGEHHWGRLVPVRQDFSPERHQKMLQKYLDLVPRRATAEVLPSEVPVGGADGTF